MYKWKCIWRQQYGIHRQLFLCESWLTREYIIEIFLLYTKCCVMASRLSALFIYPPRTSFYCLNVRLPVKILSNSAGKMLQCSTSMRLSLAYQRGSNYWELTASMAGYVLNRTSFEYRNQRQANSVRQSFQSNRSPFKRLPQVSDPLLCQTWVEGLSDCKKDWDARAHERVLNGIADST